MGSENPEWYVNCNNEIILKPKIFVNKIGSHYIIMDPNNMEEPTLITVIGKNHSWSIDPHAKQL